MRSPLKFVICIAVGIITAFFLSVCQCHAGAWTLPQGKLYERIAVNYYFADSEFSTQQDNKGFKKFSDLNVSNYLEYGITDRITLINAMYYKFLEKQALREELDSDGFGDVDLGLKGKLAEGSWGVLSTQGLVKIPGAYGKNDALPLGNGQYDLDMRVLFGRSLWPYLPGYCNFEIGYRVRLEDPSDELRYLVEFGVDFTKELYGRVKLDGILSMDNGSSVSTSGNPTATNNFDLGKLEMAVGFKLTKTWGLEFCIVPEIYGRNTTAGTTYTLALTYQTR